MNFTKNFFALSETKKKYVILEGGTRSGKTWAMLQYIYLLAEHYRDKPLIYSIVSESLPHLRRGTIRDYLRMLKEDRLYREESWNKSTFTYTVGKSIIEFFSVDQESKVLGAGRDYLFENECNNIRYETHSQLATRTRRRIFLDYNPAGRFWVNEKILKVRKDYDYIHSTHRDNPHLLEGQREEIEIRKETDPEWYRVYGLGLLGGGEGRIFPKFETIRRVPEGARFLGYGMDFGFKRDPTVLVGLYLDDTRLILEEGLYERGLLGSEIIDRMEQREVSKDSLIVGDSARSDLIEEIKRAGYRLAKESVKGAGSILYGLDLMKRYKIEVTEASLNVINELRNYRYKKDKVGGEYLNEPVDDFNHAIDGARYLVMEVLGAKGGTRQGVTVDEGTKLETATMVERDF